MAKKREPKVQTFKSTINISGDSTPFVCPVCVGNGLVPNGFYNQTGGTWVSTSGENIECNSCQGTGIVWG